MLVRFWGTRGSLPVAQTGQSVRRKLACALQAASGRSFVTEGEALDFIDEELDFATGQSYGGATSCVEIEGGDGAFIVCDMGSGLREFGLSAMARCAAGHPRVYHFFQSHLHWDHIMGFPFFVAAFDPGAEIIIHSGHPDAETALRRQQEEISFPVPFGFLRAKIRFETMEEGRIYDISGLKVETIRQFHSHDSYGYRFSDGASTVIYSTDSEHKMDDMDAESRFEAFFGHADLVICDTMYSLADAVTMKADWGHSSNIVAVDLCHAAKAKRLALFHHEPLYSDDDIQRMHLETIRYAELTAEDGEALEVICAYDGLEVTV
jgi:phosphoribosyl 1,2-cyclic phosphodiesterase